MVTSAISISCAALDIGVGALGFGLAGWGTPHGTGGGGAEGGGGGCEVCVSESSW